MISSPLIRRMGGLMRVLAIENADDAIAVLAKFFPNSAKDAGKQRFLLKRLMPTRAASDIDAPQYGC